MEVLELVQSAAFKAGIIPSFNPDELPGDILEAGKNALVNEILPGLNCDRTLDITVTSRTYAPVGGRIELRPFKQPNENFEILGYCDMTTQELITSDGVNTGYAKLMYAKHPDWITATPIPHGGVLYIRNDNIWPTDDFGNFKTFAFWSTNTQLVQGDAPTSPTVTDGVNIDFPPMRVDAVIEEGSLIPYEYLYREEFERTFKTGLPGVYTTEEYDDCIVVLINGSDRPKKLILPVPLQIINRAHDHAGTINAPEKFRRYLIDAIAVALAITYGVATVQQMQQQMAQSYQLLKKNKPQPLHKANVSEMICDKLRRDVYTRGRV